MRLMLRWVVLTVASLAAGVAHAETRCDTRPAVGGGVLTSCREAGSAAPAREYVTRPATGGGTITTGGGRTCTTREGVGGRLVTSCR
jgi:hypothetical protein